MVHADRRLTVRMIAEELSINKDTVWSIITENLEMLKVCAKMVPKLLSEEQKQQRVTLCQDIIERLEDDQDLLGIVLEYPRFIASNESPEQVWIVLEALDNVLTDSDSLLFLVLGQQLGDHLCAHLEHFEIFSDDAPNSVIVDGKFLSNHPYHESKICAHILLHTLDVVHRSAC